MAKTMRKMRCYCGMLMERAYDGLEHPLVELLTIARTFPKPIPDSACKALNPKARVLMTMGVQQHEMPKILVYFQLKG
jgi:hypothetical protein